MPMVAGPTPRRPALGAFGRSRTQDQQARLRGVVPATWDTESGADLDAVFDEAFDDMRDLPDTFFNGRWVTEAWQDKEQQAVPGRLAFGGDDDDLHLDDDNLLRAQRRPLEAQERRPRRRAAEDFIRRDESGQPLELETPFDLPVLRKSTPRRRRNHLRFQRAAEDLEEEDPAAGNEDAMGNPRPHADDPRKTRMQRLQRLRNMAPEAAATFLGRLGRPAPRPAWGAEEEPAAATAAQRAWRSEGNRPDQKTHGAIRREQSPWRSEGNRQNPQARKLGRKVLARLRIWGDSSSDEEEF